MVLTLIELINNERTLEQQPKMLAHFWIATKMYKIAECNPMLIGQNMHQCSVHSRTFFLHKINIGNRIGYKRKYYHDRTGEDLYHSI